MHLPKLPKTYMPIDKNPNAKLAYDKTLAKQKSKTKLAQKPQTSQIIWKLRAGVVWWVGHVVDGWPLGSLPADYVEEV